jgi:hypothetical protein
MSLDLGVIIRLGANAVYAEGALLEGTGRCGEVTNHPDTKPEAKAVHRIAAKAATLPSHT